MEKRGKVEMWKDLNEVPLSFIVQYRHVLCGGWRLSLTHFTISVCCCWWLWRRRQWIACVPDRIAPVNYDDDDDDDESGGRKSESQSQSKLWCSKVAAEVLAGGWNLIKVLWLLLSKIFDLFYVFSIRPVWWLLVVARRKNVQITQTQRFSCPKSVLEQRTESKVAALT